MRAERLRWAAPCAMAGLLAGFRPAWAQQLTGTAQVQFQSVQTPQSVRLADGTTRVTVLERDAWLQTYDLRRLDTLRPSLMLESSLRFSSLTTPGAPDATRAPQGSLRLLHPWASLVVSHMPTTTTVSLRPAGAPDTVAATRLTTRVEESLANARFNVPGWPQLSAAWVRRHRDADAFSPGDRSDQRNANLSYDRGPASLHGTLSDLTQSQGSDPSFRTRQRVAGVGGSFRLASSARRQLTLQADLSDVRGRLPAGRRSRSLAENASLGGEWRPRANLAGSVQWNLHRSSNELGTTSRELDQDGAALITLRPTRITRVTAGGGVRTARESGTDRLLEYATAIASVEGRARAGMQVSASASHTTNWDPTRGVYGVQTAGTDTRLRLGARANAAVSFQLTATGDSASASQRYANAWAVRLQTQPLRSLGVVLSARSYRVGPRLLQPLGVARARGVDVTWRVAPPLDVTGSWAVTGALPNDAPRLGIATMSARYSPSSSVQFSGTWSRSDQTRTSAQAAALTGRELASARLQMAFSRQLSASVGGNWSDPRIRGPRQLDAVVAWSFGR